MTPRKSLKSASHPWQSLLGRAGSQGLPVSFLPKVRGPSSSFLLTSPNPPTWGDKVPEGQQRASLSTSGHSYLLGPGVPAVCLQPPDTGPRVRGTLLSSQASLSQASCLTAPINQLISPQIFTEALGRQGWALRDIRGHTGCAQRGSQPAEKAEHSQKEQGQVREGQATRIRDRATGR